MNTLVENIYQHARQEPDRQALVGDHSLYSYQSLIDAAQTLAEKITSNNISTLALIADNSPEWIIIDLACQIAECCFIPLPVFFTPAQIQHSLEQAGVDTLLIGQGIPLASDFNQLPEINNFATGFKTLRLPVTKHTNKPEHTHKITFTSGSTGQAKGVCLSNQQQLAVADSLVSTITIEQPRHLCVLPLPTLLENIAGVYSPLTSGGSIYIPSLTTLGFSGSSRVDANKLLACIDHYQPETMILIPQLLDLLIVSIMQGWLPPGDLKMIAVGGSRVAASAIQQARNLGLPVYEGYGLSECASVVSLNTPEHDQPGSAGQLLPHLNIQINKGEITIIGNSFLGYLNEPDSWYADSVATGDLGHVDDNGFLQLQGRKKNVLISSFGRNINPEWVESEILAHPLIQQCIVAGDAKPYCSALIYADNQHLSDAEIQHWLDQVNQSLPDYAQVKAWLRLEQPLTSTSHLLTENGRPRRQAINDHFSSTIEQLYSHKKESNSMSFFNVYRMKPQHNEKTFLQHRLSSSACLGRLPCLTMLLS